MQIKSIDVESLLKLCELHVKQVRCDDVLPEIHKFYELGERHIIDLIKSMPIFCIDVGDAGGNE